MDGTENVENTPLDEQASPDKQGTSGSGEKTYTESELQKLISDGKAALGREKASLAKEKETLAQQVKGLSQELDNIKLERIRNDPDKVRTYQERKEIDERIAALSEREKAEAARKAELDAREEALRSTELNSTIQGLAAKYGVDAKELEGMEIQDAKTLEKVAKALSGAPAKPVITRTDSGKFNGQNPSEITFGAGSLSAKDMIAKGLNKK